MRLDKMENVEKKPWKDSFWMDCLFELMSDAQKRGIDKVEFADVDKLVIRKSHGIIKYEFDIQENKASY